MLTEARVNARLHPPGLGETALSTPLSPHLRLDSLSQNTTQKPLADKLTEIYKRPLKKNTGIPNGIPSRPEPKNGRRPASPAEIDRVIRRR